MLDLRAQWNWGFQVTFCLLCWRCAMVACMCWGTLCIGTGASKGYVLQYCVAILLCFAKLPVQVAVEWLRHGCSKGTCFSVASCGSDCVLRIIVGRLHWNCYIKDAIWMFVFARNIVLFGVKKASVAESWRAYATGAGVATLVWNYARRAQWNWGFQVTFSLLCWCCAMVFCSWES